MRPSLLAALLLSFAGCGVPVTSEPNRAPVAMNDSFTINEDTTLTVAAADLVANDSDIDNDTLAVSAVEGAFLRGATVTFTPEAHFHGDRVFTYQVTDRALTATGTVTVTVLSVNDAPVAIDDGFTMDENTTLTLNAGDLLANDSDVEGDTLTIASVEGAVLEGSTITFTPEADFHGDATFTYYVTDGGFAASATVTITVSPVEVLPVNDAPVATDDSFTIHEDATLTIEAADLLANDTDVDGDTLTITSVEGAVLEGSTITYTPEANFHGDATFVYEVTDGELTATATVAVTMESVNDAPVAKADNFRIDEDTTLTVDAADLLANDTDVDSDTLAVVAVEGAVFEGSTITFTPEANFHGEATFTYDVTDGHLTSSTTVTVTVLPVNDAPVAANDSFSIDEDTTLTVDAADLLANDSDVAGDTLTIVSVNGGVLDGSTIAFTPEADFHGDATFTYDATDGEFVITATVTVTVLPVNDAPKAVSDSFTIDEDRTLRIEAAELLANDSDVDGETLTFAAVDGASFDGSAITFTPEVNFHGQVAFTYEVTDGELTSTATVNVTVEPVNDEPVAANDSFTIDEDATLRVEAAGLLANDTDVDGDTLVIGAVSGAALDGSTITFTPEVNFHGDATFTYEITDGELTSTATVNVTVDPVNDAPVAASDAASVESGASVAIAVLANDSDVDGDPLSVAVLGTPAKGTAVVLADGSVLYSANAGELGDDSFSVKISDGVATATSTVHVTIESTLLESLDVLADGVTRSGRLMPAFASTTVSYAMAFGLGLQSIQIVARPLDPTATLTIDGVPVAADVASEALALPLGTRTFDVTVSTLMGRSRTYSIDVTRAGAVSQRAYVKASNTEASDTFGYSLALDGDTLAVGAYREDGGATGIDGHPFDNSASNSGAVYVFTQENGVWSQQAYLKASNTGAGDSFGFSVALDGDTLAVGAYTEGSSATGVGGSQSDNTAGASGAVYVFSRTNGVWSQQAYVKASNTDRGDYFGFSVAIDGDTLAVGAVYEASDGVNGDQSDNSAMFKGAVYVFVRTNGQWAQQAYLKSSYTSCLIFSLFGYALALDGNTLAASSYVTGTVYVFHRSNGRWSRQAALKASNTGGFFGMSVALHEDTLAVGATGEDSGATGVDGDQLDTSAPASGAVYVFSRTRGVWSQQAYVKASNTGADDRFGQSVALYGDTLAVGAPDEDSSATGVDRHQSNDSTTNTGAVYVFARTAGVWSQRAYLKASTTSPDDMFGWSVALAGDTLAVGAYSEDSGATGIDGNQSDNTAVDSGAAYVFQL